MAQERIKWTYIEGTLSIGFENEILDFYDLTTLFPTIEDMNEVQKMLIVYGFKQNLSDKIANMKDYTINEKIKVMTARYMDLVKGIWKTPAKEKVSVKKKADKLVQEGVTEAEMDLLKKLGLV